MYQAPRSKKSWRTRSILILLSAATGFPCCSGSDDQRQGVFEIFDVDSFEKKNSAHQMQLNYLNGIGIEAQIDEGAEDPYITFYRRFDASPEFFGALVALSGPNDFPDSGDLSTSDVLGVSVLAVPRPSDEVSAALDVALTPGWYALVVASLLESKCSASRPVGFSGWRAKRSTSCRERQWSGLVPVWPISSCCSSLRSGTANCV